MSCLAMVTALLAAVPAANAVEPLEVVMISGSFEYDSTESLTAFKHWFERHYPAECRIVATEEWDDFPGLEALEDCDVALFFTRRLRIDGEQLQRIKDYVLGGNPIVGVRTASHGFQNWLEMDELVLGGNYHGHYGNGPAYRALAVKDMRGHPALRGVGEVRSRRGLYKNTPIAGDTQLLMRGYHPEAIEPVTWTRICNGARVFYTSLGSQRDFEHGSFKRLLANALFWAAEREVPEPDYEPLPPMPPAAQGVLDLPLRTRVEEGSGWKPAILDTAVPAGETAVLICDMWNTHWCRAAAERCDALARKAAPLINLARKKGMRIIHCPSGTLGFYAGTPQRRRMEAVPPVEPPAPLELPDPPLPIDDSDGGCDTEGDKAYPAWVRQHPAIELGTGDVVSGDGEEVYSFLQQEGVTNLLVLGVHANMCVLNRSFGIKQMTRWGIGCVLVRDLTDAMYDPKDPPHVSHDEGTQLVVEHIEKHWCPTVTSGELEAALRALPSP